MRVMFAGVTSNAGKTLITALFCRYLRRKMMMVTPFKASNLSAVSFRTDDGTEIGTGQALQAWASDLEPDGRMNPIIMKAADGKIRMFVNGEEKDRDRIGRDELLSAALASYDELCDMYDAVVAEGSGSAAEINLRDRDVANTGLASARQIPMILVGDIEKGGVFAGIYGAWRLIEDKHLLKGFIINKYRGSDDILRSGIERIESMTGMKCVGVLPYTEIKIPEEDSSGSGVHAYSRDEIDDFVNALDEMLDSVKGHIDMQFIEKIASE